MRAEQQPGYRVREPVSSEVGAGQRHEQREERRGEAPGNPPPARRYQDDDRGEHGDRCRDGMTRRERRSAGGDQGSRRPGPAIRGLQRSDQDLRQQHRRGERREMPPLAPEGEIASDSEPCRKRHVDQPEKVEDLGDHGDRGVPDGGHQPQPGTVHALDMTQRKVVGRQYEQNGGECRDHRGDRGGTPGRGQDQRFLLAGGGPGAHPRHGAPRPHSARSSVRCTCLTSTDLGWNATAVSMGIPRLGAAPPAKLNL